MYIYLRSGSIVIRVKITMIEKLKQMNRTLLELITGIAVFAFVCQITALFFPMEQFKFTIGFWSGIILAVFSSVHMLQSLNKAFCCDEKSAARLMAGGYVLRYLVIGIILVLLFLSDAGYPLACFLGVIGLKAGAYLQPFMHRLYNYIFHETDPIPQPLCEEDHEITKSEEK